MGRKKLETLENIYFDPRACAARIGLSYSRLNLKKGILRRKQGSGFSYQDSNGRSIGDVDVKSHCAALAIPPNWESVWISPQEKSHIQAVGWDSENRKQYIYHEKWRKYRELLNAYRMIAFGKTLPRLRKETAGKLREQHFSLEKVLAGILMLLDKTYIRIGNEIYFEERKSVGLTTMRKRNINIEGAMIRFKYLGKSGKKAVVELEDRPLAKFLSELMALPGAAVFTYAHPDGDMHKVNAKDVNKYLKDLSGKNLMAKDFRTWGGTLTAFSRLTTEFRRDDEVKPEKAVVKALDDAAEALGNTRAVVKDTYVHPDLIRIANEGKFPEYYEKVRHLGAGKYLSAEEVRLLKLLELLLENEFNSLKM